MALRLRNFFIGSHLSLTDDVFEVARIILLYRFLFAFSIIFALPVLSDYILGLNKALILHSIDFLISAFLLFSLRKARNIDAVTHFFFVVAFVSNLLTCMMLNPEKVDIVTVAWGAFFHALSIILLRGWARIAYVLFFGWVPLLYIMINIKTHGAWTVPGLVEKGAADQPGALILFPIMLLLFATWSNAVTMETARKTITRQKELIEERNKEITDSIRYAKRIQQSLLPTEKYITRSLEKKQK